jgi:hypothetical protein
MITIVYNPSEDLIDLLCQQVPIICDKKTLVFYTNDIDECLFKVILKDFNYINIS